MENNYLLEKAKSVLEKNWNGVFTKPAPSLYPHQWNWDTGFIAIGLAHYNWERAVQELRHLFSGQWKNGMLPHIVFGNDPAARYFPGPEFWQSERSENAADKKTSGITQPPVFGFTVWKMYQLAENRIKAKAFLEEFFPKIFKLHQYLYTARDPEQEGLAYIMHPWSPGTDNSPTWDSVMKRMDTTQLDIPRYTRKDLQNPKAAAHRPTKEDYDRYIYLVDLYRKLNYDDTQIYQQSPFLIQDPLFNSILAYSNECLIKMGKEIGTEISQVEGWNQKTQRAFQNKLWNPDTGLFDAYDLRTKKRIELHTSSGLIPLIAGVATNEQAQRIRDTFNSSSFSREAHWQCATYDLEAENIDYEKYWRGPVWINMNWLLYQGLKRYGFLEEAQKIKLDSLALVERFGFYEYFDPRKDIEVETGYGTHQFSWTAALILDFLLEQ